MSLSTLTQCHPRVCRIHHHRDQEVRNLLKEPPPAVNWRRIGNVSLIAAIATTCSQIVSAPLDVTTRAIKLLPSTSPPTPLNMCKVLMETIKKGGIKAAFEGLPLHLMKRLPTKTLTVAFFEIGTQLFHNYNHCSTSSSLSSSQHVSIATASGAMALLVCYPLHMIYYALRKQVPFTQIINKVINRPNILYTGAIPALVGTVPAVLVDYIAYSSLRQRINQVASNHQNSHDQHQQQKWKSMSTTMMLILAAAAANVMGGFMSEPFKSVGRKMAVQVVGGGPVPLAPLASVSPITSSSSSLSVIKQTLNALKTTSVNSHKSTTTMIKEKVSHQISSPKYSTATSKTHNVTIRNTANSLLERGVFEFWRGFPLRSIRYTVSAIVSKATVQHLQGQSESRLNTKRKVNKKNTQYHSNGCQYVKYNQYNNEHEHEHEMTWFALPKRGYAAQLICPHVVATHTTDRFINHI